MKDRKKKHSPRETSTKEKIGVWIIEDNDEYRINVVGILNRSVSVHCSLDCPTVEEALAQLPHQSLPDVILLDLGLPGVEGQEAVSMIKTVLPKSLVLVLTIHDDTESVFGAICAGASGYLVKSGRENHLAEAVVDVYNGGSPMSTSIARKVLDRFARINPAPSNYTLTPREREILEHLTTGLTKKEIATQISLSYHTVDTHIRNIYYKLQVHTRTSAVSKALREGVVDWKKKSEKKEKVPDTKPNPQNGKNTVNA